jgi:hypothetical protein
MVSTVFRNIIRQLATPDHLRGRMTSVNMIFFMGGPQLGELEAGFWPTGWRAAVGGAGRDWRGAGRLWWARTSPQLRIIGG